MEPGRQFGGVRFGPPATPSVIKWLVAANAVVFLLQAFSRNALLELSIIPELIFEHGWFWQPFTYMWLHDPNGILHILLNMFVLWMFGSPVALRFGTVRFLRFYLLCGIGSGLLVAIWPAVPVLFGWGVPREYVTPTLGASGAVFGVLLAYSLLWPNNTILLLFPPIPMRAIYFVPMLFLVEWLLGPKNVSHVGHLGGVIMGWILVRRMQRRWVLPRWRDLRDRWLAWRARRRFKIERFDDRDHPFGR